MPVARSQKVAQEIRRYGPQVITIALCSALAFGLAWKTDASSQSDLGHCLRISKNARTQQWHPTVVPAACPRSWSRSCAGRGSAAAAAMRSIRRQLLVLAVLAERGCSRPRRPALQQRRRRTTPPPPPRPAAAAALPAAARLTTAAPRRRPAGRAGGIRVPSDPSSRRRPLPVPVLLG